MADGATEHGQRSNALAAVAFILAFSATFPLQQVALRSWPPVLLAGCRCFAGGLAMLAITWGPRCRRGRFPRYTRDEWWGLAVTSAGGAVFNVVLTPLLIIYCVAWTSGGLASLLAYTQPLFLTVLAWAVLGEDLTVGQMGLIFLGVFGVSLVTLPQGGAHWSISGIAAGLGAAVAWAVGSIWVRGRSRVPPLGGGTGIGPATARLIGGPQFVLGGLVLLAVGTAKESWSSIHVTAGSLASALGFTAFGTVGWMAYLYLLGHEGVQARRLGSWAFAVPLVANALGIVFLDEKIDAVYVVGALVVATSIFTVELTARQRGGAAPSSASSARLSGNPPP